MKALLPISAGAALALIALAFGQPSAEQPRDPRHVAAGAVASIICPPQPHLGAALESATDARGSDC